MTIKRERFVELLDDVASATEELNAALERIGRTASDARDRRESGQPVSEIIGQTDWVNARHTVTRAMERMHRALRMARGEAARVMVSEERKSIAEVARILKRPRQVVDRLYRAAKTQAEDD